MFDHCETLFGFLECFFKNDFRIWGRMIFSVQCVLWMSSVIVGMIFRGFRSFRRALSVFFDDV